MNIFIKRLLTIAFLVIPLALNMGSAMAKSIQIESMTHTLSASQLKDNTGLVYIGYEVNKALLAPYLAQLKSHLGNEKFKIFRAAQAKRDHNSFHITLINPFEYPDVKNIDVTALPKVIFTFEGLGTASNAKDSTYFVVVSGSEAQKVRQQFGLKKKDFHATLGFDSKDVFGVKKDKSSVLER